MGYTSTEQATHDKLNLVRLVHKLEQQTEAEADRWPESLGLDQYHTWLTVQSTLQKVRFARTLLKKVQADEELHSTRYFILSLAGKRPYSKRRRSSNIRYEKLGATLDYVEERVKDAEKRVPRPTVKPKPLLPSLPLPEAPLEPVQPSTSVITEASPAIALIPGEGAPLANVAEGLLISPDEASESTLSPITPLSNPIALTPLVPSAPSVSDPSAGPKAAPSFLQNSTAVQNELQDQLAQMAAQLRRNAQHFSSRLAEDKALVDDVSEKLDRNFDVMTKERVRLRDRRVAARGNTWLVVCGVIGVLLAFIVMVFIIRVT
ncbi:hypothetical protein PUNSTDRAFT_124670 [Punctularia strigosozonata HHB-11173 SS5]|uniref:uncharacterized protein n=1 Tax=Punctularia strigosozonata (strain HHB-11173) TaxID=741275 RepID=UPI00044178C3|nr:uncharacterized protein PUNSTDRAFT_124670 [Punctularia strigosozonata HHB-11173 SS5]EIN11192.1 hypothetical protein PUNSTDRAFT_124670 [Punctularia strigosozonata HHB-11173 SS5]